jgi:hypothetical protein
MAKDTTLAVLTHILGWLTGFIGPLIILLVTKDKDIKKHAKNALNWQFSLMIYFLISFLLMMIVIGFVTIIIFVVLDIVFCIKAAVKAGEDKVWKYPMSIKFFRV